MSNVQCPYCGSTESIPVKHATRHAVMCLMCKAMGPNMGTEQEAIAAWNRRYVKKCEWKIAHDGDWEYWETACGKAFIMTDGKPKEHGMNYCCYCGGELIERSEADNEESH